MLNDPCNVIPDTSVPTGLTAHRHHIGHHVVGRIKHTIHHKFPIVPRTPVAYNPDGCEKHAILPPRPGGNGIVGPGVVAPGTKFAALGGAGAGLVALGVGGGIIGGIIPGLPTTTTTSSKPKVTITPPGINPVGTTPVPTTPVPTTPVPPITPTTPSTIVPPSTPPVPVPEPSTLVVFLFAVGLALAARQFHRWRSLRPAVSSA